LNLPASDLFDHHSGVFYQEWCQYGHSTYTCTKEKLHPVICFWGAETVRGMEIHQKLLAHYGDRVLLQQSMYKWDDMFKHGCTRVTNKEHHGGHKLQLLKETTKKSMH
jgi:hypothetical protein